MVKTLLFLLSAFACLGQAFTMKDTAFLGNAIPKATGVTTTPTNLVGFPSLAWYVASDFTTNATPLYISWPDRWTNGWALTNAGFADPVTNLVLRVPGGLNGKDYLLFPGTNAANCLISANYTSQQPHEIVMVMNATNARQFNVLFDGWNSATFDNKFYPFYDTSGMGLKIGGASAVFAGFMTSNKWQVVDVIFNGADSRVYTNNVLAGTVNPGTAGSSGLIISGAVTLTSDREFTGGIAEIACYGGGNPIPGTNTAARTALFNYLTNYYGLSP